MGGGGEYHVFTRIGDATAEIEALVQQIGSAEAAGLHRCYFVSRANQTVVMTTDAAAPIARHLRHHHGWIEPGR
jgi:hypothetical protein